MTSVEGLTELLRDLKKCDTAPKLAVIMAPAQPKVARLVEDESRSRASSRQMRRAERSNTYKANKSSVTVQIGGGGGDKVWAVGAQFGSVAFWQFPGAQRDGYTVVPAAKDNREQIADIWAEQIASHFP